LVTQAYRAAAVAFLLVSSSCAYSFRGSLPEGIKSVQIEQFRSTVTEYGLEQDITALVTESIVRDGRLSIDNDNPDVHITGSVSYFSRTAVTYTAGEEVEQYKLEIRVVVSMGNAVGNEYIIRDETVSEWLLYDPSKESFDSARDRLVAQVSDAVVRRSLSGW
jgi:hypothetical protein